MFSPYILGATFVRRPACDLHETFVLYTGRPLRDRNWTSHKRFFFRLNSALKISSKNDKLE